MIAELMERLPEEVYHHSRRVAILTDYYQYPDRDLNTTGVALLHDILEDTATAPEEIQDLEVREAVEILTRKLDETYLEYIRRIAESGNEAAYIVKLCDLTDHLLQTKTLSPSLKSRYEKAMKILLDAKES